MCLFFSVGFLWNGGFLSCIICKNKKLCGNSEHWSLRPGGFFCRVSWQSRWAAGAVCSPPRWGCWHRLGRDSWSPCSCHLFWLELGLTFRVSSSLGDSRVWVGWAWTCGRIGAEDTRMADKHVRRCSTSLVIREMQIKTTVRHHLTPVRTAAIEKSTDSKCWRGCGEEGTSYTLGGNAN